MEGRIQKWGNSFGLRIPKQFINKLHLFAGSTVDIKISKDQIIIKPQKKYDLETMLSQITPDNLHNEFFKDDKIGNEEW